jgi:hypothetical protein
MGGMKTMAAGKFRHGCLNVLDEVERTVVVTTQRGRPVA